MPNRPPRTFFLATACVALSVSATRSPALNASDPSRDATASTAPAKSPAEIGYDILRTKPFLPPDFDQQTFDRLWTVWPTELRTKAALASPEERRRLAFSRYGLLEPPDRPGKGPALGYVDDGQGNWTMNCLACHGGKVEGRVVPGLPNSHFALQTLVEEVRLVKTLTGRKLTHMDVGSLSIPLGTTAGTTNAVVFGIALGALRDADMNVDRSARPEPFVHHDMDAPPLWHAKRKKTLYIDAFSPKNHRVLMQFILVPQNDRDRILKWESDFARILDWIESLEPPKYAGPVDRELAERGRLAFEKTCARCHGTYGPEGRFEQQVVPIEEIGTDRVRFDALTVAHRRRLQKSWMSFHGADPVVVEPVGYAAPPLDGVWASAPYFHNGAVPTLWHVLHPQERPRAWTRTEDGYDHARMGLEVRTADRVPDGLDDPAERRRWFDTTRPGKSPAGHTYPESLSEPDRRAVLEYLKTL